MIAPISRKSSSSRPRIVIAGVPTRNPEATVGGRSSNGTVLRLTVMPTSARRSSASLPLHSVRRRSTSRRCVSVPPVSTSSPPLLQRGRERVGIRPHCALVVAERLGRGDPEARRLGRDHVVERPALHAGEHRAVDRLRVLLATQDEPGTRAGERLVRRRGDEVAVLDGVRLQPRGDEPGEVSHVAEEQRADLVGDLAEAPGSRPCAGTPSRRRRSASADAPSRVRARRRSRRGSSRARRRSGRSRRAGRRSSP